MPHDDVDVRGPLEDQLLVLLGHAAEDADDRVGMALLERAAAGRGRE